MKEKAIAVLIICISILLYLTVHELGHAFEAKRLGIKIEKIHIGIPYKQTQITNFNLDYLNIAVSVNWILLGTGIEIDINKLNIRSNEYLSILRAGVKANIICISVIIILGILLHKETRKKRTGKLILISLLAVPLMLSEVLPLLFPILGIQLIVIAIHQKTESSEFLITPFLCYESRFNALENISAIMLGITIIDSSVIPIFDGGKTLLILLDRYGLISL